MANPGPFASEYVHKQEKRRFFDDYCNWELIPQFEKVIGTSEVAAVAANLMQSRTVQLFHDHVLVKNRELQSQHRGIRMDHIILLKDRKQ